MNDGSGYEEVEDEALVSDLADRFTQAANAAGQQALKYPSSNIFVTVSRYRDFSARAANITGSLLVELDETDLETAATVLKSEDLVEEIRSRRDEQAGKIEQQRALRVKAEDDAAVAHLHRFQEEAAIANATAAERETDRHRGENQKAYQAILAERQREDDLQRADALERQATAFRREALEEDADTTALVRKAATLRATAAQLRGQK